jgi:hypothetical protein
MARIPLGNQGDGVAQIPQPVQSTAATYGGASAAADAQIGQAIAGVGEQVQRVQSDYQRTAAGVAYQQHQFDVQSAIKANQVRLSSGEINQEQFQQSIIDARKQSFDNTIGGLPDGHYKNIVTQQVAGLNRVSDLAVQESLLANTRQQTQANAAQMLDTGGKQIALMPDTIDQRVGSLRTAYAAAAQAGGIPVKDAEKSFQDWSDKQYMSNAQYRMMTARGAGDLDALKKLEFDLTDPKGFYANKMDANQRNQVLSSTVSQRLSMENAQQQQIDALNADGQKAYNEAIDFGNTGKYMSPEYQQQLVQRTAGTPYGVEAQKLIRQSAEAAGFASMTIPQQTETLRRYQSSANTPGQGSDPQTMAQIKKLEQIHTAKAEAFKTDPWKAALDYNNINAIPPLDMSSVPNLMGSLAQRSKLAGVLEQANGGNPVSLFTPTEADGVLKMVSALPIDQRAQILNQIGGGFSGAGRINALAKQWHDKDEAMSLALKAGAGGGNGNPLVTTSGTPVSAFILSGQQAIKDKTVKVEDIAGSGLQSQVATQINGVLPAEQEADAKRMAYFIAVGSAARNGRTAPNSTDIENGINAATGGITNTGGTRFNGEPNRVAMPYGWTESQFTNSVKAAGVANIENTVNGAPVGSVYVGRDEIPAADFMAKFPSYKLVRVGVRGTYAVQAGQQFVSDVLGRPVTVHLNLGQQPAPAAPTTTTTQVNNPFGG